MLMEKIQALDDKVKQIEMIHNALPEWYPITSVFAKECGYKTTDGLQKWCYRNLPPNDFVKKSKLWYISIRALHQVKLKATSIQYVC